MTGQITIDSYFRKLPEVDFSCKHCICEHCLYYSSGRCPYGRCFDDKRAVEHPYDKAHPEKPPRTAWSDWNKPGEQAHWCRGGLFYPTYQCEYFEKFKGLEIKECIKCNVSVFQDGYMNCSLVDSTGCERCYQELMEKMERSEGGVQDI